ncbi:MAG TPA: hypothetical protein V6D17_07370 [Candidatus Obscuribacterales bacterium]
MRRKGQSLVESLVGLMILIPIGLAAFDVVTMVSCYHANEQVADSCARAAATRADQGAAVKAAEDAVEHSQIPGAALSVGVQSIEYNLGTGMVTAVTTMQIKLPVPLPYVSQMTIKSTAVVPIVGTPAPQ